MGKSASSHMSVGKGRLRKALRAVLLAKHADPKAWEIAVVAFGNTCAYCGCSGDNERLQPDHLWPEAIGGLTIPGNIVPACPTCNSDRRDTPWETFLRTCSRIRNMRTKDEIEQQAKKIADHMNRYGQKNVPSIDQALTNEELELLEDVDLLLAALSDGALAKAGHTKERNVLFDDAGKVFDDLVKLAKGARLGV